MVFQFLDFELDPIRFQLRRGGAEIAMPRQTFDLILLLVRHRDRPVTKTEILDTVWPGRTVTPASLTHAIAEARRLLGDTAEAQGVIKTVHGRGYWWVAETREVRLSNAGRESPGALPFVGRALELGHLASYLDDAQAGRGSLALLLGEAGIGKTRLAQELARRASERGFSVVLGRCIEEGGAPPGWGWVQVLRLLLESPVIRADSVVLAAAQVVRRFFPELATQPIASEQSSGIMPERFLLFDSIWRLLTGASKQTPLLIVLDDIHLGDSLSNAILAFCTRQISGERILFVATARDAAIDTAPSVAMIAREPRARAILLKGLSESDAGPLLVAAAGSPNARLRSAIFERSGGNPFFLTQILAGLLNTEEPYGAVDDRALLQLLPATVREAVASQLRGLPPESVGALEAAAVAGPAFGLSLLAEVLEVSTHVALELLERPTRCGLIQSDLHVESEFKFRHSIVRDVVYDRLASIRRRELHCRYARALRAVYSAERLTSIAHHLRAAYPLAEAPEVAEATIAAARQSCERAGFREAVDECSIVLRMLADDRAFSPHARCELLLIQATAQLRAGDRGAGRASLRSAAMLARDSGLSGQLAEAALAIAPGFFAIETGVVDPELVVSLEEALRGGSQEDSAVRVRLLGNLATALYWSSNDRRRQEAIGEARSIAARLGTPEVLAHVLASSYTALWSPESLGQRLNSADQLVRLVDQSGAQDLRLMARVFRVATFMESGDAVRAKQEVATLDELVRSVQHPHAQWYLPMYQAMWEITRGRFEEAKQHISAFLGLGMRFQDANVVQTFLLQSAEICWQTGRTAEIMAQVEANVARNPNLQEWQCAQAFLLARAGRLSEARTLSWRLVRDSGITGRMNTTIGLAALAECCNLLGDAALARSLRDRMGSWSDRMIVAGYGVLCWGSSARAAGHVSATLGEFDEAEAHYLRAEAAERAFEALAWLSRTRLALGRLYLRRGSAGDREKAEAVRAEASDWAERCGLAVDHD